MTTVRAGDDHAAPGRRDGLDHRVVAVLAVGHRRAEARQDEQRVVDAHADPDQARDGRRPVGHVDDVGQQDDQAAGRDAQAHERDHQRQAGGDDRPEGDQQDDRGAEEAEALGARRLLRGVDRVAAELDLEPVAAVLLGGGDQLLAVLLGHVPARDGQRQGGRADRAVLARRGSSVCGRDVVDLLGVGQEGVDALARGGAARARPRPSRRRRSPGPSSRSKRSSVRSLAPPWTPSRACCSRRCTRRPATEPTPMITIVGDEPREHHAAAAAVGQVGQTGQETGHRWSFPSVDVVPHTLRQVRSQAIGVRRRIEVRVAAPAGGGADLRPLGRDCRAG